MSSNRVQAVRYSLKGSSQPKTRSLASTSGDLFDKLKSSVASKTAPPPSAVPKPTSKDLPESENHQGRLTDSLKYSYSHSPRYALYPSYFHVNTVVNNVMCIACTVRWSLRYVLS